MPQYTARSAHRGEIVTIPQRAGHGAADDAGRDPGRRRTLRLPDRADAGDDRPARAGPVGCVAEMSRRAGASVEVVARDV